MSEAASTSGGRRGLQLFGREHRQDAHDTPMMRSPELDQAARDALPEFREAGGSEITLLFGDPEDADDGGMSLVSARFEPNYHLPRHSHSVDCLYYVVAGELHLGRRVVSAGEGFFVPADAPYGYTAGPEGVEVLEFRARSAFDSRIRETAAGWERILTAVRDNRDHWAAAPTDRGT